MLDRTIGLVGAVSGVTCFVGIGQHAMNLYSLDDSRWIPAAALSIGCGLGSYLGVREFLGYRDRDV